MMDEKDNGQFDLEQYDDEFSGAQCEIDSDDDELPPGKYQMVTERAELQFSAKGHRMLVWRLRVLAPRYAGRKHWHRNMIITKDNLKWLKHDLLVAGLELTKLSDLPGRLDELCDVVLEVQLKKKGDMTNTFFNRRVRAPAAVGGSVAAPSGGSAPADDDFPF